MFPHHVDDEEVRDQGHVNLLSDASFCFMVLLHDWSRHEALHAAMNNLMQPRLHAATGDTWVNVPIRNFLPSPPTAPHVTRRITKSLLRTC